MFSDLGEARSCKRERIRIRTRKGEVVFVGRPGGSRACGEEPRRVTPAGLKALRCAQNIMRRAQKFCDRISISGGKKRRKRDVVLHRLCMPNALRSLAHASRCRRG